MQPMRLPANSRRHFIKKLIISGMALPLGNKLFAKGPPQKLKVHIFSKHLQFLCFSEMADAASQMGFDGVDLTVRPHGHVLPDRVENDLPRAVEAMLQAGLEPQMITTTVENAADQRDQIILRTAARLGVRYYRMNWLSYPQENSIPESIKGYQQQLKDLGSLNGQLGLVGCYQNHAGTLAGASLFELYQLLELADQEFMGAQYDIRHATVEGGKSWENGLRLIAPRIKTLVLKDFRWERKEGSWETVNTPLGQGMVDFKKYFALLKNYGIDVPVSLHMEYPLGGAEHGASEIAIDRELIFEAMRKDLQFIHQTWADY